MHLSAGRASSPIWLIGDSLPKNWEGDLREPLDSRHPARHNIWTPVLDRIQRTVFLGGGLRLDDAKLYVRNAVDRADAIDEKRAVWDWDKLAPYVDELAKCIVEAKPKPCLVLSFGAFACEMVCRARRAGGNFRHTDRAVHEWTTKALADAFRRGESEFDPSAVNHLPLLHVSIARRHFLTAHQHFCGELGGEHPNYFEYVGDALGTLLIQHMRGQPIWLQPDARPALAHQT